MSGWRSSRSTRCRCGWPAPPGAGAAARPHLRPDAMLAAVTDRTPADLRVQSEQPDVDGGRPPTGWRPSVRCRSEDIVGVHRRGLRRVHPRRPAARQPRPGPQVTRMSLCCAFPEGIRAGWRCGWVTPSAIRTSSPRWARCTCRSPRGTWPRRPRSRRSTPDELLARTDAVVAERPGQHRTGAADGLRTPDSQANFVWLPLGPSTPASSSRPPTPSWCARTVATGSA